MRSNTGARVLLGHLFLLACVAPAIAQAPAWTDWARVRNVPAGDEIIVVTTTGAEREYRMAFADEAQLVLARPLARMSPAVLDAMRRVGPNWPAVLGGRVMVIDAVRISPGTIQEASERVSAIDVLPRGSVREVRRPGNAQLVSTLMDIAAVGAVIGARSTRGYEQEERRRAGFPTASGGFPTTFDWDNRTRIDPRDIIYRAIPGALTPTDDATWQQQLRGLPKSLQGKGRGR